MSEEKKELPIPTAEEADALLAEAEKVALDYEAKLDELRNDGTYKIDACKSQIKTLKANKLIKSEKKQALIQAQMEQLEEAKAVQANNAQQVSALSYEASAAVKDAYLSAYRAKKLIYKKIVAQNKETLLSEKNRLAAEHQERLNEINSTSFDSKDKDAVAEHKKILASENISYKNLVREVVENCKNANQKVKDEVHSIYTDMMNRLSNIHGNKNTFVEKAEIKAENYIYNFSMKNFLMKNGLYLIILAFMIVCICINPFLISTNSIMLILKNFSTKIFFALGVAGLILLAGTDLSIGRMISMGSLVTCMMLNPSSPTTFWGLSISGIYDKIGFVPTLILALLFSVLLCTGFSLLAGFFSAKFKIHPFITTLGTSLVIWGLCGWSTNNIKTGTVTSAASKLVMTVGSIGFPIALIYAIIAIAIIWFVWNKTKFGKNMYAIGDNAEAAAVSGISVFKTTLGVFAMAGILYGIGSFLQGITTGSSYATFGQGWELEAIAACVVGGISFSGGIGKISGAVLGCLIFEILKYYLRDIAGGNADITNIFIGAIIITAVTFDSIKYLKRK